MADEVIIKVDVTGDGSVDKLNNKLDQTEEYSKKATSEISRLRRELREAKGDMLKYAEGTEQYNKALRRAAEIQGKVKETNDIVKAGVRDLGETTKRVAGTISGLASGFQVAQGAMALFGVENDAVLETMMKMQALMSITSGIAGFANGIDDLQDLMIGFRAEASKSTNAVGELSKVSGEATNSMANITKEGAVIGSNLAGVGMVANEVGKSMDKLTEASINYTDSIRDNQELKALETEYHALYEAQQKLTNGSEDYIRLQNNMDDIENKMSDIVENETDKIKESLTATDKSTESKEKLTKTTEKVTNGLKSQLLTMGLWIAAIAVATYAITKLIEWMNEIPEDLKIELGIYDSIKNDVAKSSILINNFIHDWNKAIKDTNNEKLKQLIEYAKKEQIVNETQLKNLKTDAEKKKFINDEYFKAYLKTAENTYFNESIIKQKAEAKTTGEIALVKAQESFKEYKRSGSKGTFKNLNWDDFVKSASRGDLDEKAFEALGVFQVAQSVIDNLRIVNEQNKIIKSLSKIKLKTPDDFILKTSEGKPSGSKISLNKSLDKSLGLDIVKQKAERVARESFTKPILDTEIKYTNEELVIMNDNNKRRVGIYDDAIEDQIDYVKRREDARQKDLNNELTYQYGQKALMQEEINRFNTLSSEYDNVIADLNSYNENKVNLLNTNAEIENKINNSKNQKDIEGLNKQKQINLDAIKLIESDIAAKQLQKTALEEQLKGLEVYPEKMKQVTDTIAQLNVEITNSTRTQVEIERDLWKARVAMAKEYLDAISNVAGGLADIAQGNMDLTNAEYDQKIWANDEMIQSDEQRANKAYEIEMARWNALQKDFEMQKKMKEAQAWMDFASGSVGIWTAPGITSLAPYGYILAGIQQAALLATTIGNIKSIKAQQMLKPHKSGSNSGGGSGGINVALNPAKDALTSRDENLNTMSKSNIKDIPQQKVLVSDINDVQAKVKTREENSSF